MAEKPNAEQVAGAWLFARTVALDLLLRAVFTRWAMEKKDPEKFIFEIVETAIAGMQNAKDAPVTDAAMQMIWDIAENELRGFGENVTERIKSAAARTNIASGL